ncbi:MAG TPA: GerMN domain-containing protein [Thermoanaerobaculia bacterium]|nr:GerMN domain-containing protein [Thermoanaerobaculia bacterium]
MRAVPTGSRPPRRRRPLRTPRRVAAFLPLLCLSLAACGRAPAISKRTAKPALDDAAVTDRVRVFLIAPHDGGRSGVRAGCGDSAVPVEVALGAPEPALPGALRALLAMGDRFDPRSGLYNPLYASPLKLVAVERTGADRQGLRVRLAGYLESGGECDGPRILAQLERTALQFPQIHRVEFLLDGQSLAGLLAGKGADPAKRPATSTASPGIAGEAGAAVLP